MFGTRQISITFVCSFLFSDSKICNVYVFDVENMVTMTQKTIVEWISRICHFCSVQSTLKHANGERLWRHLTTYFTMKTLASNVVFYFHIFLQVSPSLFICLSLSVSLSLSLPLPRPVCLSHFISPLV